VYWSPVALHPCEPHSGVISKGDRALMVGSFPPISPRYRHKAGGVQSQRDAPWLLLAESAETVRSEMSRPMVSRAPQEGHRVIVRPTRCGEYKTMAQSPATTRPTTNTGSPHRQKSRKSTISSSRPKLVSTCVDMCRARSGHHAQRSSAQERCQLALHLRKGARFGAGRSRTERVRRADEQDSGNAGAPSPGLRCGAASPDRLATRQSTEQQGPRQGCRERRGGTQRRERHPQCSGGLGLLR
jgi:hypothetical protein